KTKTSTQPKRRALPPELPRVEIYHEPEDLQCNCGCALKRIGEDVTEKLDYIPGKAQVERPIRGKLVCKECETLTQSPMPAHVIDKGLASHRLLAQRTLVPDGSGTAKALDYSLKRWAALTRYLEDCCVPIDNNHI